MSFTHPPADQLLCFDTKGQINSCSGALLPEPIWVGKSIYDLPLVESMSASLWSLSKVDFPITIPKVILENPPLTGCFDLYFYKLSDSCMQLAIINHTPFFEELQRQKQIEMERQLQIQQHKRQ